MRAGRLGDYHQDIQDTTSEVRANKTHRTAAINKGCSPFQRGISLRSLVRGQQNQFSSRNKATALLITKDIPGSVWGTKLPFGANEDSRYKTDLVSDLECGIALRSLVKGQ